MLQNPFDIRRLQIGYRALADTPRMRQRHRVRGAGLVDDRDTLAFDDDGATAALVIRVQHAGIDFDNGAIEALEYASAIRRRMADDDAFRTD